jgi:Collagen triple helix repeat (20 copies)
MISMSISKMGVSSVILIAVAALAYSKSIDVSAIPEQALVINLDNSSLMVQGADGADGVKGADGADGVKGADGADGVKGADGADGVKGADGADGADGQSSVEEIFVP